MEHFKFSLVNEALALWLWKYIRQNNSLLYNSIYKYYIFILYIKNTQYQENTLENNQRGCLCMYKQLLFVRFLFGIQQEKQKSKPRH